MNSDGVTSVPALADAIERYLEQHPKAADTMEGILVWWLRRGNYLGARERIEEALEHLTLQGRLDRRVNADGNVIYARRAAAGRKH